MTSESTDGKTCSTPWNQWTDQLICEQPPSPGPPAPLSSLSLQFCWDYNPWLNTLLNKHTAGVCSTSTTTWGNTVYPHNRVPELQIKPPTEPSRAHPGDASHPHRPPKRPVEFTCSELGDGYRVRSSGCNPTVTVGLLVNTHTHTHTPSVSHPKTTLRISCWSRRAGRFSLHSNQQQIKPLHSVIPAESGIIFAALFSVQ